MSLTVGRLDITKMNMPKEDLATHPLQRALEALDRIYPLEPGEQGIRVTADNVRGSMIVSLSAYFRFREHEAREINSGRMRT